MNLLFHQIGPVTLDWTRPPKNILVLVSCNCRQVPVKFGRCSTKRTSFFGLCTKNTYYDCCDESYFDKIFQCLDWLVNEKGVKVILADKLAYQPGVANKHFTLHGRLMYPKDITLTHLSKGPSGQKQKCTRFLTPFSGTVFHALSHGVIHFVRSVSFQKP